MKLVPAPARSYFGRMSPGVRNRLLFLTAANLLLMGFVWLHTLRTEGSEFSDELSRFGANIAPVVLAGLGMTGIIATGAIDLSIGAIFAVAGTVFGILYRHDAPPVVCFAACVATAAGLSALNGATVRLLRLPAIIVTLAGLTFYRGIALVLADLFVENFGGQFSIQGDAYHTPGKEYAGAILIVALLAAIGWEMFGKTPRTWLALGSSQDAVRLKGLHPGRVLQSSFNYGGLFLGLAALVDLTNRLTIEPARTGEGLELDVIGAVVLGGTNIFGGEGSFLGTALGGAFLYWVQQVMLYAGVSEHWRTAIRGGMIVAVIAVDCALHRKRKLLEELR